jgi:HlyD family secretion protein
VEALVEAAKQRLDEALAGARPQEIREAEALAHAARRRYEEALTGTRPQEKREALQQVEIARQKLNEALSGARAQELREVEAVVAEAQAQADAAKAVLDLAIAGPRRETVRAAKARVEQAKGTLAAVSATRKETAIYAPASGVVTLRNVEPGELVTPGLAIVRMAKLKKVWLRVYVPEPQVGLVKLGQHAKVVTDTYPGKSYEGTVIEIAEKPEFTPKNVQTKQERVKLVFGVKIDIDNAHQELKPGMPADAWIDVATGAKR